MAELPPTAQQGSTATGTGLTQRIPLSRQAEHKRIEDLKLVPGARIEICFRNSETDTSLPSEWDTWLGEVVDRVLLTDGHQAWRLEYERPEGIFVGHLPVGPGYDVCSIDVVKKATGRAVMGTHTGSKRERDPTDQVQKDTTPAAAGSKDSLVAGMQLHDFAKSMLDGRLGKATSMVRRGDGLKIPAYVTSEFRCCYVSQPRRGLVTYRARNEA